MVISVTVSEMESQETGMENWRDGYLPHLEFRWLPFQNLYRKMPAPK